MVADAACACLKLFDLSLLLQFIDSVGDYGDGIILLT